MVRMRDQEKRNAFLSAALRLFVAKGVQNTSTAEIAREAGTAAGTLFLYFPTKQDLINELVIKMARDQSDAINAAMHPGLSAKEAFAAIWNGTVDWFSNNMEAFLYILQVRDSGIVPEAVVQETAQFYGYYFTAIQKGLTEGSIEPYPSELIGDFLYHDLVSVMNLIRRQPEPAKRAEYIDQGFEIFWNGIRTK